LPTQAARLRC